MNQQEFEYKEELRQHRLREQKNNNDYSSERELCDNCGAFINSHDHCPNCDY
tara:strand:- start:1263 stop:1418 length:156 start_codon:yes stop_codon:yes gene_type:complete